jgi:hypothetical protein
MLNCMSGIGGLINLRQHNGELEYRHQSSNFSEVDRSDLRTHKDDWLFHVWHFNG